MGRQCKEVSGGLPTFISPWIDGKKAVMGTGKMTNDEAVSVAQHEKEWNEIFDGIHEYVDACAFQDGHIDYDELDAFFSDVLPDFPALQADPGPERTGALRELEDARAARPQVVIGGVATAEAAVDVIHVSIIQDIVAVVVVPVDDGLDVLQFPQMSSAARPIPPENSR